MLYKTLLSFFLPLFLSLSPTNKLLLCKLGSWVVLYSSTLVLFGPGVSLPRCFSFPPPTAPCSPAFSTRSVHRHSSGIYISLLNRAALAQILNSAQSQGFPPPSLLLTGSPLVMWLEQGAGPTAGSPPRFQCSTDSHLTRAGLLVDRRTVGWLFQVFVFRVGGARRFTLCDHVQAVATHREQRMPGQHDPRDAGYLPEDGPPQTALRVQAGQDHCPPAVAQEDRGRYDQVEQHGIRYLRFYESKSSFLGVSLHCAW